MHCCVSYWWLVSVRSSPGHDCEKLAASNTYKHLTPSRTPLVKTKYHTGSQIHERNVSESIPHTHGHYDSVAQR